MTETINQVVTHIQSVVLTLAFMVVLASIVGYVASKKYGGQSRKKRKLIFVGVGLPIILIGTLFAQLMIRTTK